MIQLPLSALPLNTALGIKSSMHESLKDTSSLNHNTFIPVTGTVRTGQIDRVKYFHAPNSEIHLTSTVRGTKTHLAFRYPI